MPISCPIGLGQQIVALELYQKSQSRESLKSRIIGGMKTPATAKKLFHFENPRQGKIYTSLQRFIGEAPASFYKDACKIYEGGCDLETKTHLIGHLMREVFGWIIDIMLPVDYALTPEKKKESEKNKDSYRKKINRSS